MRQPFFVTGYKVTDENMEIIARWCEGRVIDDGEKSFIRVPVNRATNIKQTQAYVDMWVLMSFTERGDKSFKVYSQEWLDKQFTPTGGGVMNEMAAKMFADLEIPDDDSEDGPVDTNRIASNLRILPSQPDPRIMNARPSR